LIFILTSIQEDIELFFGVYTELFTVSLEDEGHIIIQKGRKNIRYYVKDYEKYIFDLSI